MEDLTTIEQLLEQIKAQKPLIHHITNSVTINDCANITLAIGASPVMADEVEEAAEMTTHAQALVINIGTLSTRTIPAMIASGEKANQKGIPVIFDPVGVGATPFRMRVAKELLETLHFSVLRGNMSEIKALAGLETHAKGVDAGDDMDDAVSIAKQLAKRYDCIVAVTGKEDIVSDGIKVATIKAGHPLLAQVSGTGCMSNSLIASFAAVTSDSFSATIAGLYAMGRSGEIAFNNLREFEGAGTFHIRLLDAISLLSSNTLLEGGRIYVHS
ncbi:hydroxyethylthiazole kinase [Pullulanibacillus camelliae]|uniref:Hydroxyethylthiazole kinase n=1 Tax=Pullulanibacillus camelliae TaxID=1707096 RepID=A0A8J2YLW4_9BACL|nr:hydroxyethylthiazole kinase [Pullulanibacillus camelliae]GGE52916.1 hydroxyethylthiazole kinase [Pullulanibacillus camelliae]